MFLQLCGTNIGTSNSFDWMFVWILNHEWLFASINIWLRKLLIFFGHPVGPSKPGFRVPKLDELNEDIILIKNAQLYESTHPLIFGFLVEAPVKGK